MADLKSFINTSSDRIKSAMGVPVDRIKTIQGSKLNQFAPIISSLSSGTITDVGATVAGTVNNGKLSTVWSIEYGLTDAYGSTATGGTITEITDVTKALTGLAQNTTYHWRIKAVNSKGTTYSSDQTLITTNVRWVIPITGQTSGVPTNSTLTITSTEDITPTVTGDVTYTIARVNDDTNPSLRKHTIAISCPNNKSGTIIITDRSKVIFYKGYSGTTGQSPIISLNFDDFPSTITYISHPYNTDSIQTITGSTLPSGLKHLHLNWVNFIHSSALPSGLTYFLQTWKGQYNYAGTLPSGLTVLNLNMGGGNYTGLDFSGTGNMTEFALTNFRTAKLTSTQMITILTSLTNRVGSLPATITINDYADYASPPTAVTDAVAALKAAKSITTVNLGA